MEKLLEILNEIDDEIDYENEEGLIDDALLDSLSIISLVAQIENEFDIEISPVDLVPDNFNSMKRMIEMIKRLQED